MSTAKLHHYVPQAYLARFGQGETVAVKRRHPAKVHDANVRNIAAQTGLYTITAADGTASGVVEEHLAELDGLGMAAVRWIDEHDRPPAPGTAEREILNEYLAVQFTRTPRHRAMTMFPRQVAEYADGREITQELVAQYLEQRHLRRRPSEQEARAAWTYVHGVRAETGGDPTQTDAIRLSFRLVEKFTMASALVV